MVLILFDETIQSLSRSKVVVLMGKFNEILHVGNNVHVLPLVRCYSCCSGNDYSLPETPERTCLHQMNQSETQEVLLV